ncbi:DUF3362 domain-containing protein [Thiorhodococcus minor]|uniref:DUF3362 domain-containing protein n=1 Tax=Thiorhodococcus minor TaxID=57489 RepID=A0A6M0JU49_9GAMM|nr:DUF3362 domain-containing protein [Thiorhodococcus minor]
MNEMGRADLIGNGKRHLVPSFQPAGTGGVPEGRRKPVKASSRRTPTAASRKPRKRR